ncbi:MAG TPA: FAD-dependent oxidoreductase, partial [Gemmataceae bacterium]|nr:FAD-dependent oxidoreductase [Gemmataceae bacterium]
AGPIGCELSQAFRRFGSEVHLINRSPGLLGKEEPEAVAVIRQQFEREEIHLHLGAKVRGGEPSHLIIEEAGNTVRLEADAVLIAVGRRANVEGLGLEQAGVEYDAHGVRVNDFLRTSNRRIYAAGDVCSPYKFTHVADALARIALRNAFYSFGIFGRARASDLVIPWCTYTDPEVAHVGLTAAQAHERGMAIRTFRVPLAEVDRAVLDGETNGFALIHVRKSSDRIVGATIVAAHAGEMIGAVVLAMTRKLGLSALAQTIFAYPTQAEAIKRLGDAYQKARLTPWTAAFLRAILRGRR